jgi:beta-galactosidase
VSRDNATVQVKTRVRNDGASAAAEYEFVQQIRVDKPVLWGVEAPYLYNVRSTLKDGARVLDVHDTPVGIRDAQFDADRGFLLNGERVKLNGVCLHHEAASVGAAVPERVWERRMEILKEMGCNAIRTSHNPYAAEFLDLCDRMGFLVMNEMFDEWKVGKGQIGPFGYANYFDEWYERDVKNFVHRDRNHPSVVIWSAGNEIGDQSVPNGAQTLRKLLDVFHTEDPTRPVTAGCDQIASEPASHTVRPEFLALLDVVGYNYSDRWRERKEKYYSIDKAAFPQRRVIGTESGAMGGIRGGGGRGRGLDVEALWKFVSTYDYVAGDFMWTGIDYLGESRWPGKGSFSGVIDSCGFKKDGFYFYQSQWTKKPMLYVTPHWNWKGREGQFIPVTAYTNCDTVELLINGKSAGVKGYVFPRMGVEGSWNNAPARMRVVRTTNDLHLSWDIPYEPGTLKAVGTKDGKVVCTVEVATAGEPTAVAASVDRETIPAGRQGIAHVTVVIADEQGRMVPTAANEVTFAVDGDAKIIGVDNGDMQSHDDYKASRRKAFNGMCLAILQSSGKAGAVKVTASSPGLRPAVVTFTCG